MPRGDHTGPMGQGPMTGWGTGYCAGSAGPGYVNAGPGRGRGRGRGLGFGWSRALPDTRPEMQNEPSRLRAQSEELKKQLSAVEKRLEDLDRNP